LGNLTQSPRRRGLVSAFGGQYNWATVLLKAGELEQAALWFERSATGGTPGVRRAVTALVNELITRGGAMAAFQKLAAHLNAAALPL
jgi:hypothetical protein